MSNIYNLTDTWNAAGTTFTAIKMNVTDTASAAGSRLIDLQVAGSSKLYLDKSGALVVSGPVTASSLTLSSALALSSGGTGATTAAGARVSILPALATNGGKVLAVNAGATDVEWITLAGGGSVTSVNATGGATGLTFSGGPITGSGSLTLGGVLALASGGTGAITPAAARVNLLPSYSGNGSRVLALNAGGTDVEWVAISTNPVASVSGTAPIVSSGGVTPTISITAATTSAAGSMSAADKSKLDGIATGATANTGTVTGVTGTAPIVSSGGTAPAISISAATTSAAGSMSAADKTKLDGMAAGATANAGTVTSVSGSGTVSGLTLSGTGTGAVTLTLGGTLSLTSANVTTALSYTPSRSTTAFPTSSNASLASLDLRTMSNPLTGLGYAGGGRFRFSSLNDNNSTPYADVIDLSTYTDASGGGFNALYLGKNSQLIQHKYAAAGGTAWTTKTIAYTDSNITGTASNITGVYGGTLTSSQVTTALGFTPVNYTLPKATATTLGGVEVFDATVQTTAANAATSTAGRTYGVQLNANDQMVVNVPWVDTTTDSTKLPLAGGTMTGALTLASASGLGNGNPRSLITGYSGGNYGQTGYGIAYTTTSDVHNYAINDAVSLWEAFDGLRVRAAPAGTVGTPITWTTVLDARRTMTAMTFRGNAVLDANNYNSYAPTLTGTNATGTWGINITGTASNITGVYGGTITSSQVTTALGFTPYNSTNPSGYTSNTGTVTGVTGTAPIVSSGGTTPAISISAATTSAAGSMSAADKTKLDGIASGATASSGTVTSVSVVSANGFAGTVATNTTTPAITLSTSISGLLKGNGTAISAAVAGTDYVIPSGSITGNAGTATTLQTARLINGVSFNGSANITITDGSTRFQSSSDFVDGTLVTTDIPANVVNGNSFIIEITGKSYSSSVPPFKAIAQGYLYNNTITSFSGINYGGAFSSYIKVFEDGGVLKFWWPRITYWNSFNVNVMSMDSATNGNTTRNRVTAIANSLEPTGTKKVQINLATTWNSTNFTPSTYLPLVGGTMTGAITFAAGQTWPTFNQSTTGSAATLTTARTLTIGSTGKTFNGSANVSWNHAEIGTVRNFGVVNVQGVVGSNVTCTTDEFITWLTNLGAFAQTASVMKCSWSYAGNNDISDTGFGQLDMAGCIIETFTDGAQYIVRVTSPSTGSGAGGIHEYVNHGPSYSPGWRRVYTSALNGNITGTASNITGTYGGTLTSSQITTGLGFTPYNATNPNGYTSNAGTVTGVTGTAPIVSSGGTAPAISISAATTSAAGSMSAADKTKLDGIATGATANSGTVTSVSVVSANGFAGSVATNTTTPAITISTSISGLLKGNGTAISQAIAGTDYVIPSGSISGSAGSLSANSNYMVNRGTVAQANVDTATSNGFYIQSNPSDSQGILVFNPGGSLGPLQMTFTYTGLMQFRNRTDSATWTAWKTVLTSANFNTYAPTLTGGGASGTWSINVTGNAATVTNGLYTSGDQGTITGTKRFYSPNNTQINTVSPGDRGLGIFQETTNADAYMTFHISNDYAAYFGLGGAENDLVYGGWSAGANRYRILHSGNYTSWVPSTTGTGASGTWGINVTGTAGSISGFNNPTTGATANTIVYRDGNGDDFRRYGFAEYFNMSHGASGSTTDTVFYSSGDNYIRKNNATGFRASLNVPTRTGGDASGTWGISVTGSSASASTLSALGNYAWSQSTLPTTYPMGVQASFVGPAAGEGSWQNYGSVMTMRTYSGGGGSLQLYVPYGPSNGGTGLQVRFGNYDVTSGNSWTSWKTLLASDNFNSYALPLTGGTLTGQLTGTIGAFSTRIYTGFDGTAANSIGCSNWFRSNGDTGWLNSTHGGGINMIDTTWVRVYGSKAFYVNNELAALGNVTAYYSDERLKTKTGIIDNAVDKVKRLSGFTYVENELARELGYKNDKQQVGVSAQEVQAVLPEAVSLAPVDYETLEDGSIVSKTGENYLTVDYSRLVPLLIEAVKEQQAQIDELKNMLAKALGE